MEFAKRQKRHPAAAEEAMKDHLEGSLGRYRALLKGVRAR